MALPTGPEVRISLDWLRYTMPMQERMTARESLLQALPRDNRIHLTGEKLSNARGYDSCMGLTIGRIHWHSERPEQQISVEFSGSDCNKLHVMGLDFANLWEYIEHRGGHITTLHFALDLHNLKADHKEVETALQAGEAKTRARAVYTYAGGNIGKGRQEGTTYVGKSASERQLRVYNKAAEQGVKADWTRIELVVKGKRARAMLEALQRYAWDTVGRSAIAEFVQWETCDWWQAGVTGEVIAMPVIGREETNTVKWLLEAVLPTLIREVRREAESEVYILAETFTDAIGKARRRT